MTSRNEQKSQNIERMKICFCVFSELIHTSTLFPVQQTLIFEYINKSSNTQKTSNSNSLCQHLLLRFAVYTKLYIYTKLDIHIYILCCLQTTQTFSA